MTERKLPLLTRAVSKSPTVTASLEGETDLCDKWFETNRCQQQLNILQSMDTVLWYFWTSCNKNTKIRNEINTKNRMDAVRQQKT